MYTARTLRGVVPSRQIINLCVVETEDFTLSYPRGIIAHEFRNYNTHEIRARVSVCVLIILNCNSK